MANFNIADQAVAGNVYCAANVSAKSVIAVTTAMTGVILYNPVGSGVKMVIIHAGWVWTTVPGAVHNVGLALAAPNVTIPSSLTAIGSGVLNANGNGTSNNSYARVYDAATLAVAPVLVRWSFGAAWGSSVGVSPFMAIDRVDGAIALMPGAVLAFAAVTTTAVGMGSLCWAEVPANP